MTATETVCSECGSEPSQMNNYCGDCGAGPDPWEERDCYDFERDVSLPLVFSSEVYNDTHGLWRDFCSAAFGVYELRGSDIANFPEGVPSMKYQTFMVYYKLDEDLELHGPFLEKSEAREA